MSKRFWLFSLATLIGTILLASSLVATYRSEARDAVSAFGTDKNAALARSIFTATHEELVDLIDRSSGLDFAQRRRLAVNSELSTSLVEYLDELDVFRVNVFDQDYYAVFSTDETYLAVRLPGNPGIRAALAGEVASELVEAGGFSELDQWVEGRNIVHTYLPVKGAAGNVVGVLEVYSDVTDLLEGMNESRRAVTYRALLALGAFLTALIWLYARMDRSLAREEEIESESRVKAAFVATMSHEIRTPMNAVLGMSDLLRLTDLTRKQEGYVRTIQSSGAMLMSLVDNIVDFVGIDDDSLSVQMRDFRVSELLDNVLDVMGYHADSKGLELIGIVDADSDLVVTSDRNRLRQVLVNLVGNAIKFSHDGEIVVRITATRMVNDRVELKCSVSDQGEGIPQSVLDRLFEPFAAASLTSAGTRQGSGLGLAICKEIVERLEGSIEVDSLVGIGTVVSFTVPLDVAKTAAELPADRRIGSLRDRGVLVINHSYALGLSICSASRSLGMRCHFVGDADAAAAMLEAAVRERRPYAAVVMESRGAYTVELDGARRIRALGGCETTPIILLVPVAKPIEPGQISSIGGVYCVSKPVQFGELRETLFRTSDVPGEGAATASSGATERRKLRVLVAEDNPVNQQVMVGMLASLGHDADCVDDGEAALERLASRSYDIVLMDCQMPGLDGDEVTRRIRANPDADAEQPVIIAVTADTTLEHRAACLDAGMDDFFPKPVRLDALRDVLARWQKRIAGRSRGPTGEGQAILDRLRKRTGSHSESFLSGYIDLFLEDSADRLRRLNKALDAGDIELLRRECHSLKGACLEFGADRMGRLCDEVRGQLAETDLAGRGEYLDQLEQEFARVRSVFESELGDAASRPG